MSMFSQVMGLDYEQGINESFLGFLIALSESTKFNFPKFIVESMHEQLTSFNTLKRFKYQSYLMYLIIDKFPHHFQNLLEPKDPTPYDIISMIHRASFLRNQPTGFFKFVNEFMSEVYAMIHEERIPRVSSKLQTYLHPSAEFDIGNWFLYMDYIVFRVYGAEVNPYGLPTFLTPRIFALEILRRRFNSYFIQFSSKNQVASFKLPLTIGPFTVKNKEVVKLIDEMMACYKFEEDQACQYDPYHIISYKRKKLRRGGYEHKGTIEMEKPTKKLTYSSEEGSD